jgi:hypothetical protein
MYRNYLTKMDYMRGEEEIKVLSQVFYFLQYNAMFSSESQPTF